MRGGVAAQQLHVAEIGRTPTYGCRCDAHWYGPTCTSNSEASPPPIEAPKDPTAELCKSPQFKDTKWCEPCAQGLRAQMLKTSDTALSDKISEAAEVAGRTCDAECVVRQLKAGKTPEEAIDCDAPAKSAALSETML